MRFLIHHNRKTRMHKQFLGDFRFMRISKKRLVWRFDSFLQERRQRNLDFFSVRVHQH